MALPGPIDYYALGNYGRPGELYLPPTKRKPEFIHPHGNNEFVTLYKDFGPYKPDSNIHRRRVPNPKGIVKPSKSFHNHPNEKSRVLTYGDFSNLIKKLSVTGAITPYTSIDTPVDLPVSTKDDVENSIPETPYFLPATYRTPLKQQVIKTEEEMLASTKKRLEDYAQVQRTVEAIKNRVIPEYSASKDILDRLIAETSPDTPENRALINEAESIRQMFKEENLFASILNLANETKKMNELTTWVKEGQKVSENELKEVNDKIQKAMNSIDVPHPPQITATPVGNSARVKVDTYNTLARVSYAYKRSLSELSKSVVKFIESNTKDLQNSNTKLTAEESAAVAINSLGPSNVRRNLDFVTTSRKKSSRLAAKPPKNYKESPPSSSKLGRKEDDDDYSETPLKAYPKKK
jgi:succinate dehydrogenase flavin-adding protein (antitoxin of CptAB toxin-antitoxin module)